MEQLIVRLGGADNPVTHWLVWSTEQQDIIASGQLNDDHELSSLAQRAGTRPVIALIPGSEVNLTHVELPAKAGRKAMAAIPYMLEEELAEDIDALFFALGPRSNEQQAVAIIRRATLLDYQQRLTEAGLFCDKLIPDTLAMPCTEDHWSFITLGDEVLIRQSQWMGMQGHRDWVLGALALSAKQQAEPVVLDNYSDVTLPPMANIDVQVMPLEMPMQVLAVGAIAQPFNLLQGEFKIRRERSVKLGQWRAAAVLAGLALTTTLVDRGLELQQLSQQRASLSEQIAAEYQRGFPQGGAYRDLRRKVRDNMTRLEQGGGSASMLVFMSQLSEAFATSQVKPQTLRFDSKRAELRMLAEADNFEALEQFKRLAEAKGFTVEQGAINNRDNTFIGSLSIRS
ncbi:type II secretion system protein GspL [Aestuariibacter halophilus]|uniref:Type II secretion system protein L n=1 Tax=Fluctibacter halophilus TaxID=226011 RepID=A0ABS8G923_9ALTE|nr:type II secretion system protein GspL [Aestuariibacter halophilus]MCC2617045.1 type II secretion system protein GspL [Aestuariibacter halophilus]